MEGGIGISFLFLLLAVVSLAGVIYPFRPFGKRWIALASLTASMVLFGITTQPSGPSSSVSTEVASSAELAPTTKPAAPKDDDTYWVTSDRLNRRTCPSLDCGVVGQFFFREGTKVLERHDGWARVTRPYDASCVNGRSQYVDAGNAACDPSNGIEGGRFAEWVSAEFLTADRPPDPANNASVAEEIVAGSDDFARYRRQFASSAHTLISQGRCTKADFRNMGGWVKSTNHRSQPIYFTYCGGMTIANRLYLNAETGEIFH